MSSTQVHTARPVAENLRVRPSVPDDASAIIALMKQAGLHPHVQPEHLHWKYWRERSDWPGARSFVLTGGGELLAHGAVVPGTLRWGTTEARVIHMIDWAARRDAVGVGVMLMMHVGRLTDFMLGIGGSNDTLKILPRIGYRRCGGVTGYVRTIAPLDILKWPARSRWRVPARIARSLLWTLAAPRCDLGRWTVRRVGSDEVQRVCSALPAPRPDLAVFGRSAEILRHALSCPIVPVELHTLEQEGRVGGYFLLSYPPGQARLADYWMDSEDPADWRALMHAAVHQARQKEATAELVAWSSDPALARVMRECGFHERLDLPIYIRASGHAPVPRENVRVQMLDNDAFYLYIGRNALWA